MYNSRWLLKVFNPLIRKARSKGVNVFCEDRFIAWIRSHRNPDVSDMYGEVLSYMRYFGNWEETVEHALA
ncbi:MAG: hypothetical protein CL398_11710 [Acidiferrobacteraceae bacterium]|nr:hypothetical protein [Acidiferrobacteraceae bacterium]